MMTIRVGLAGLVAASIALGASTLAVGSDALSPQERKLLRSPDQAMQVATDRVNAARQTFERAQREADPSDRAAQLRLRRASHDLSRAERALATGHSYTAYVLARRVDTLGLAAPEVQQ